MTPKRLYIFLIALLGLLILGSLGGYFYMHKLLANRIQKIQQLSGDIVLENAQLERLRKLEADYKKNQPLANKVQSVLPNQKQQSEVISQISAIVASNGLPLNNLTFEPTKGLPDERSQTQPGKVGGILVMPVKFESSGSYQQLQSLLKSFEKQERYMRVSTLAIERNPESNQLTFNVTLEVFLKQ